MHFSNGILLVMLSTLINSEVHGGSVEKRSDDSDPLASVVEQLSSRVTQLEAQVQVNKNDLNDVQGTVGFSLRVQEHDMTGLVSGQIIKFDNVLLNAGGGYSPLTGAFTTPTSGTYVLYLQTLSFNDDDRIMLDIMKNGHLIARTHAGYSHDENGSTMLLTHLDQGDVVHVQVLAGSSFLGDLYTNFVGFRISSQ